MTSTTKSTPLYSSAASDVYKRQQYNILMEDENLIDFSSIQTEAYKLLIEEPSILEEIQQKIKYVMVDEYQDTNYIQELLVFLIAGKNRNICVVGDDDQGLYRFRGATIRNILEFPGHFAEGECTVSYTHLRAHETGRNLVCRLLLEKKKQKQRKQRKRRKHNQSNEKTMEARYKPYIIHN